MSNPISVDSMIVHDLKCLAPFFDEVMAGRKLFELRVNDRGYEPGHYVRQRRYLDAETPDAKAPAHYSRIGYLLDGGQFGLADGWVAFSLIEPTIEEKISLAIKFREVW